MFKPFKLSLEGKLEFKPFKRSNRSSRLLSCKPTVVVLAGFSVSALAVAPTKNAKNIAPQSVT